MLSGALLMAGAWLLARVQRVPPRARAALPYAQVRLPGVSLRLSDDAKLRLVAEGGTCRGPPARVLWVAGVGECAVLPDEPATAAVLATCAMGGGSNLQLVMLRHALQLVRTSSSGSAAVVWSSHGGQVCGLPSGLAGAGVTVLTSPNGEAAAVLHPTRGLQVLRRVGDSPFVPVWQACPPAQPPDPPDDGY